MNSANNSDTTHTTVASCSLGIAIVFALIIGCERKDFEILQEPCSDRSSAFWGSTVPDFSAGSDFSYAEKYEGTRGDICRRFMTVSNVPEWQIQDAIDHLKEEPGCETLTDVGSTIRSYFGNNVSEIPIWFDWAKSNVNEAFVCTIPAHSKSVGGTTQITVLIVSRINKKCWYSSSYER